MGGRGASSASSRQGNAYGSQYRTLATAGNVKFVTKVGRGSEPLMETMTAGRVYAHVEGGKVNSIVYFDTSNRRSKQIDLNHRHGGEVPHVHHGYFHNEGDSANGASRLTSKEAKMVERVTALWENINSGK